MTSHNLSQKLPPLIPRARRQPSTPSDPPPETPELPLPQTNYHFLHPTRRILTSHDHDLFLSSPSYKLLLAFVFGLSDSVRSIPVSAISKLPLNSQLQSIISILDEAQELLSSNPPLDTGSRFGNPAFRSYVSSIDTHLRAWHSRLNVSEEAIEEVSTYLAHSFGSSTRIDYGSGHELNFVLWLLCLNRLNLLPPDTFPQLTLIVFPRYLKLMREVQSTYYLEPAGSHGVW